MSALDNMKTLDQLPLHTKSVIRGFNTDDPQFRKKLLSMGIIPGAEIEVIRVAPLKDPIEVRIRGFQMCLRRREAANIFVGNEANV